jgi:hypothetical protein
MMRANFNPTLVVGCAICCLLGAQSSFAGSALFVEARPFAERFLSLLDAGNVTQAYEMLNPEVRARLEMNRLSRLGAVRGTKGEIRRKFVRVKSVPSIRMPPVSSSVPSRVAMNSVIVCFVENPTVNFKTVSYTAVTVSSNRLPARMQIDNFQTTSEPVASCR